MKNQSNQVKERPIIFSGEMVKAILDGKKTMTRRVVKSGFIGQYEHAHIINQSSDKSREGKAYFYDKPVGSMVLSSQLVSNPYGKVGDRLWVRETHHVVGGIADYEIEEIKQGLHDIKKFVSYKADGSGNPCDGGWDSPIHMPRWASRILLEITDIRVERLQDISEQDCEKEGFRFYSLSRICFKPSSAKHLSGHGSNNYRSIFGEYWDTLNAKKGYPWSSNPWVWAVEFKVIEVA